MSDCSCSCHAGRQAFSTPSQGVPVDLAARLAQVEAERDALLAEVRERRQERDAAIAERDAARAECERLKENMKAVLDSQVAWAERASLANAEVEGLQNELVRCKASEAEAWAKRRLFFHERNEEARKLIDELCASLEYAVGFMPHGDSEVEATEDVLERALAYVARAKAAAGVE